MNRPFASSKRRQTGWVPAFAGLIGNRFHKKHSVLAVNIFWLNTVFSIFYWVMESVRDVLVFEKGGIFERIFSPDPMSFWMRMLVIFIFILFSIYSNTLRIKIDVKKIQVPKSVDSYGIILAGFAFSSLYWMMESFRDVFVFDRGDFIHRFFIPDPMAFWMRMLIILILMLFSIYIQSMINDRRKAETVLKQKRDDLERQVHERTEALQLEIIERKRAEEEKERIQGQLLQAQKMEAIGILAGGIAHDFNNLLTAIQGWAELLLEGVDEKSSAFQDVKEIRSAIKRASDITQQLLLFSRKKPMQMKPVDFNGLVARFLKICHCLIGETIEINTDFQGDLWNVKADRGTIEQMIMNLAVNARDAMPNGGTLTLQTENILVDETRCRRDPEARPGPFVRLTVSDTGLGMSPETLRHVFEPFFTTKGPGIGTGLGLSVTYGIVKQHDGWISVHSEQGHGTTFRVYLPTVEADPDTESEEPAVPNNYQGRGERILVVEDESNVAEFNQKALSQYGYSVFLAKNFREAKEIFQNEKGGFQLVFSDVVLPDGNGIDLMEEFLRIQPDLQVILSSGYTDHRLQWPLVQTRGHRFLQKPYSLIDLLKAIQEKMAVHPMPS